MYSASFYIDESYSPAFLDGGYFWSGVLPGSGFSFPRVVRVTHLLPSFVPSVAFHLCLVPTCFCSLVLTCSLLVYDRFICFVDLFLLPPGLTVLTVVEEKL